MREPESVPVAVLVLESSLKMAAEGESLDLTTRKQQGKLDKDEEKFLKKLIKALGYRQENPRHNSLASHEIDDLTRIHGLKIFQSYLENNTPSAGRLFWAYGPDKGDITVLAIEPHPEDQKRGVYQRIKLSRIPAAKPKSHGKS